MDFYELGLFEFLKSHGNAFEAADGIVISETDGLIRAGKRLMPDNGYECRIFRLFTAKEFAGELSGDDDIKAYNEEILLSSDEPVYVEIAELEMELTFEPDKDKDMMKVYSLSDHFYDETELMTEFAEFEEYLKSRRGLLYAVYECRNKYLNGAR